MEQFPSMTVPSSHPSPQEYASLDHLLNVSKPSSKIPTPLTGQQVMVPITTKAFFQGSLAPLTTSTSSSSTTLSKNDTTANNLMNRERVLMNLGQDYMVEMTRDNACDFIHRRCATMNSSTTIPACGSNKEKDGPLVMKKGFLNKKSHCKKQNNRKKKNVQAEDVKINQEIRPDLSSSSPPHHKMPLLQTQQQQEQKYQQQDMKRKDQTTTETSQVLPYFEIREEYDEDGNEIKAEALNVSAELTKLQEVLKNNDQDGEVDTTERAANINVSNENEDERIKERREVIRALSDNLEVRQEQIQQVAGSSNTDDGFREIEEYCGDTKSSCTNKKEIDYEKITARLKELAKLEEQDSMNSKSAKSLQGKGWAKGFFNEKNRRNSRKQKIKPILGKSKITNDCKSVNDERKVPEEMDMEGVKKKGSRRVKFSGSDQVREIPRVGTATAYDSLSNTSNHKIIGDRSMSETVLQRPSAPKSRNSNKVVSVGSVMERSVDVRQSPSKLSAISNNRSGDARQQTSNTPTQKPLSRFAQQRLNKY